MQTELNKLNEQLSEVRQRMLDFQQQELNAIASLDQAERKERRSKMMNAFTLGLYCTFGGQISYHSEIYESKRQEYHAMQLEEKQLEGEKIRHMRDLTLKLQNVTSSLQMYRGDNSSEQAANAITMAAAGVQEVISAIDSYKTFLATLKQQVEEAFGELESVHKHATIVTNQGQQFQLTPQMQHNFIEDFKSSFVTWAALAYLGDKSQKLVSLNQTVVAQKLSIPVIDREAQLQLASQELDGLRERMDSRDLMNQKRIAETESRISNPQLEIQDAQTFTATENIVLTAEF